MPKVKILEIRKSKIGIVDSSKLVVVRNPMFRSQNKTNFHVAEVDVYDDSIQEL